LSSNLGAKSVGSKALTCDWKGFTGSPNDSLVQRSQRAYVEKAFNQFAYRFLAQVLHLMVLVGDEELTTSLVYFTILLYPRKMRCGAARFPVASKYICNQNFIVCAFPATSRQICCRTTLSHVCVRRSDRFPHYNSLSIN